MVVGIIAEYNPFHNGHLYQINKIRQLLGNDASIIACISGGFTQRGELPVLNKWQRAALAVKNGANLVIELPALFATRSAQHFAFGGVSLLHKLNIVDHLAFSSEHPDLSLLTRAAHIDISVHRPRLQQLMSQGCSYASATAQIIADCTEINIDILKEPNTILAIEYIKALSKLNSRIIPLSIQRIGAGHNDPNLAGSLASGTAIRNIIEKNEFSLIQNVLPESTYKILMDYLDKPNNTVGSLARLYPALQLKILTQAPQMLNSLCSISEGLEYSLMDAVTSPSMQDFVEGLTGKRYQQTKITRLILHILLNITKDAAQRADESGSLYVRVLAFDNRGRELLKAIKKTSHVPIITKVTNIINRRDFMNKHFSSPVEEMLYYDLLASELYELCQAKPNIHRDFITSPIYVH